MVANPFSIKNCQSQSFCPYSSTSIDVKTGSPDPADFSTTWLLIYWRVLAICTMVGRPLAYRSCHTAICQSTRSRDVVKSAGCGISGKVPLHIALWWPQYAKGRPNHCAYCHRRGSRSRVVAKVFKLMDVVLDELSLLDGRFLNRKKGLLTISLGLYY
jgi:hypothetical protein